jgi:hypothetical protein
MGSRGGSAPNPYRQRQASTLFLRVPNVDWTRVKIGEKTEFRTMPKESSRLISAKTPTPVVAYTVDGLGRYDAQLMVLEDHRYEPVFAIADDPDAIAREGFESYDHFRRYFRKRTKGVYRPMQPVHVWRVRRWAHYDHQRFGLRLLAHLYGDWLPPLPVLRGAE